MVAYVLKPVQVASVVDLTKKNYSMNGRKSGHLFRSGCAWRVGIDQQIIGIGEGRQGYRAAVR
eukprot:scaffold105056_cov23-Tisochrysis_lutea.AAC.1